MIKWFGVLLLFLSLNGALMAEQLTKQQVVDSLQLQSHIEGGYYKRTFEAADRPKIDLGDGPRFTLTSIFYMLTDSSPIGHWHLNKSDIIHYYHMGGAMTYYMIDSEGVLTTAVLGPDILNGQQLQLTVKGGTWKASELSSVSPYGLLSEAVAPGFEFEDMTLGHKEDLLKQFPQHADVINRFAND